MDAGAKEQLAMKLLDEAFIRGTKIVDHLDTIEHYADPSKQDKLRKEAIKFLIDRGYAEYESKGVYKVTPTGINTAKQRRK